MDGVVSLNNVAPQHSFRELRTPAPPASS